MPLRVPYPGWASGSDIATIVVACGFPEFIADAGFEYAEDLYTC